METKAGLMLPAGTVMLVYRNYAGLRLSVVKTCKHCGVGQRSIIARVPESDVELLEET
jgi:hypothetical protein